MGPLVCGIGGEIAINMLRLVLKERLANIVQRPDAVRQLFFAHGLTKGKKQARGLL